MQINIAWITSIGSSNTHWYGLVFLGVGVLMFFPVEFLTEISDQTGWQIGWRHVIWLEAILVSLTVGTMVALKYYFHESHWFEPLGGISVVALMRGIMWFINQLFGSDDE